MVNHVRANESKYFSDLSNIIYIFETICGESDPATFDLTNYSTLHLNQEFIDEEYKKYCKRFQLLIYFTHLVTLMPM